MFRCAPTGDGRWLPPVARTVAFGGTAMKHILLIMVCRGSNNASRCGPYATLDVRRADTANFAVTFGTQAAVEAFRCGWSDVARERAACRIFRPGRA